MEFIDIYNENHKYLGVCEKGLRPCAGQTAVIVGLCPDAAPDDVFRYGAQSARIIGGMAGH